MAKDDVGGFYYNTKDDEDDNDDVDGDGDGYVDAVITPKIMKLLVLSRQ